MIGFLRLALAVLAVTAGGLLLSCGDDGDDGGELPTATAAAVEEPTDTPEVADGAEDTDGGDTGDGDIEDAFGEIPLPAGAEETSSGTFRSSEIPFVVPGEELDPEAFTTIAFKQYSLAEAPDDALEFYKGALDNWDEVFTLGGGGTGTSGGAFGVWTRDNGRMALWIAATPTDGTTDLLVILGTQE